MNANDAALRKKNRQHGRAGVPVPTDDARRGTEILLRKVRNFRGRAEGHISALRSERKRRPASGSDAESLCGSVLSRGRQSPAPRSILDRSLLMVGSDRMPRYAAQIPPLRFQK